MSFLHELFKLTIITPFTNRLCFKMKDWPQVLLTPPPQLLMPVTSPPCNFTRIFTNLCTIPTGFYESTCVCTTVPVNTKNKLSKSNLKLFTLNIKYKLQICLSFKNICQCSSVTEILPFGVYVAISTTYEMPAFFEFLYIYCSFTLI